MISLHNLPTMFCKPNFKTNKIFALLNPSIDWSKKIAATKTTLI